MDPEPLHPSIPSPLLKLSSPEEVPSGFWKRKMFGEPLEAW